MGTKKVSHKPKRYTGVEAMPKSVMVTPAQFRRFGNSLLRDYAMQLELCHTKHATAYVQLLFAIEERETADIRQGFLSDDVYPVLKDSIGEPEIKLLYVIAYHTGIRKGELLAVKWDSVDLEEGFIDLAAFSTKNGEGRRVPILAGDMTELLTAAKQFRDQNFPGCPWVFHRAGKKIVDFRTCWKLAVKAAGVPNLLFHDLRRSAVRNMRRAGVPQVVRMKISGHKTDSMERRYSIVDDADLEDAKCRMEQRKI